MEIKKVPHYQRIARQLKSAIEHGELAPGSRLPASRVYAQELGVSRRALNRRRCSRFNWVCRRWIFSPAACGRG